MVGQSKFLALVAGSVLLALAAPAFAQQNIINLTFDGPPDPAYNYFYDYSGGGNPQTDTSALSSASASVTGNGRGGGNAFTVSGDFTSVPPFPDYTYYGIGGGLGVFRYDFGTSMAQGLPSGNLADYTYTFDLGGVGFTQAGQGQIDLQLLVPDDRFTPDADTGFDPFAVIRFQLPSVGPNYQTYSVRLDQGTLTFDEARVPAGNRDFSAHAIDIGLLNAQFQLQTDYGRDSDNRFFVDNVLLTVVPEPASGLLLAAGAALLSTRRRRRSRH